MFFESKRGRKIKDTNHSFLEAEEILLHRQAREQLGDGIINQLESPIKNWGIKLLGILGIITLLICLGIIFNLNVISGENFQAKARKNSFQYIPIPSERGLIYDREGKPLVENNPTFDLVLYPNQLPFEEKSRKELISKTEAFLNLEEGEILKKITIDNNFLSNIILKKNISNEEVISIESYFSKDPAISAVKENNRKYFSPFPFSHILGYLGEPTEENLKNNESLWNFSKIGQFGIEAKYDEYLRGVPGEISILRNARMEILGQDKSRDPQNGYNLKISIDKEFQEYLYNRLEYQTGQLQRRMGAVAIAMDSNSGEILSLVSYPGFDINKFSRGLSQEEMNGIINSRLQPLFNRAISGKYNPGSTIKPIMASIALNEEIISPNKKITTNGFISIPNPYNPDNPSIFVDWKNHGVVDMYSAIAKSSNVYFYILGGGFEGFKGLGIDKIGDYLGRIGFEKETSIDLIGEKNGFVPGIEKTDGIWRLGDTYNASIGQGNLLVTPIRLLSSLNSLVNGGKILKPRIGLEIFDSDKSTIWKSEKIVEEENIFNNDDLIEVKRAMIDTVRKYYGTGNILSELPFSSGGKSGTAQTASKKQLNALFFAFAPADNPKISILILIENAQDGSLNATPVVKDALYWWWKNRGFDN